MKEKEQDNALKRTKLDRNGRSDEPICCICKKTIQDDKGTYWVKGIGGIFSRGVYPSRVYSAHWGRCATIAGRYFAQFPPDENDETWFWGHLPFCIQTDDTPSNTDRYIYVIKSGKRYKVGISKNVVERMANLQTGDPVEHAIVYTSFVENAESLEKELHEYFSTYWVHGEWFELPPDKLEELLEILSNKGFVEKIPPFENVVYYSPGTRVIWEGKPGVVHSLVTKPYPHEIGYNILLDEQRSQDEPSVTNSGYSTLRLEATGQRSIEGYELKPVDSDSDEEAP